LRELAGLLGGGRGAAEQAVTGELLRAVAMAGQGSRGWPKNGGTEGVVGSLYARSSGWARGGAQPLAQAASSGAGRGRQQHYHERRWDMPVVRTQSRGDQGLTGGPVCYYSTLFDFSNGFALIP
jgi:hypothetical protein